MAYLALTLYSRSSDEKCRSDAGDLAIWLATVAPLRQAHPHSGDSYGYWKIVAEVESAFLLS